MTGVIVLALCLGVLFAALMAMFNL